MTSPTVVAISRPILILSPDGQVVREWRPGEERIEIGYVPGDYRCRKFFNALRQMAKARATTEGDKNGLAD